MITFAASTLVHDFTLNLAFNLESYVSVSLRFWKKHSLPSVPMIMAKNP